MKKGDVVKCVDAKNNDYLTNGKNYEVITGEGDYRVLVYISSDVGFEIVDDDGEVIFQFELDGSHGLFEVQK